MLFRSVQAKAGPWCTWCTLYARCKTARAYALEQAGIEFTDVELDVIDISKHTLSNETLCRYALAAPMAAKYLEAVVDAAKLELKKGYRSKCAKLLRFLGRRTWGEDTQGIISVLTNGQWKFKLNEIAPRSLVGITAIEAMYRKWLKVNGHPLPKKDGPTLPSEIARKITRHAPSYRILPIGAQPKNALPTNGEEFSEVEVKPTRRKSHAKG